MRFSLVAAAAVGVAAAGYVPVPYNVSTPSYPTPSYTEIPCEGPTTVTYGSITTYVTEKTTLTLECPTTTPEVPPPYTPSPPESTPYTPVYPTGGPVYPSMNATSTYVAPTGGYSTTPSPPEFTGAASQAGVGLAAVAGVLAYLL
ncbi:hypothetical protein CC78DRAFT_540858 [Lojkania enalia]|uniref:Uncharacterized protein n=1 Tax=Lojkania enalia TaxID=147567 RepID=A0A9P4KGA2_9PLEO|nr:hypothetical protein CC78DRAFT_540858 [Didymosphaeria enalia]